MLVPLREILEILVYIQNKMDAVIFFVNTCIYVIRKNEFNSKELVLWTPKFFQHRYSENPENSDKCNKSVKKIHTPSKSIKCD